MRLQLVAFAALLVSSSVSRAFAEPGETQVASDVLVYTDTDNVVVFSPQVSATHDLDEDGGKISARYVLDAISAASADVVSSATYRFSELRNEVAFSVSKKFDDWLPQASYRYSHEPDYQSNGLTFGVSRDLAGGDATVGLTAGLVVDSIGRVDTPSSAFSENLFIQTIEGSLTQTVDTKTLVRLVYSLTIQSGYMEKPYRSVPLFDSAGLAAADAMGGLDASNYEMFRVGARPLEEVPDSRIRHAIAARGLRYIEAIRSSARLDYRFYFDSWGMTAHTVEPALAIGLTDRLRVDAWTRFHWQSSTSFWKRAYEVDGPTSIPALRSSDRSLSKSWHLTVGSRVERNFSESLFGYLELGAMYSSFPEFLFLDTRTAIIGQGGMRWRF